MQTDSKQKTTKQNSCRIQSLPSILEKEDLFDSRSSLMGICRKSDPLMIVLELRPHRDSCYLKKITGICAARSLVYYWKVQMLVSLGGLQREHRVGATGCQKKKSHFVLPQISFRKLWSAMLSHFFLFLVRGWQAADKVTHENTDTEQNSLGNLWQTRSALSSLKVSVRHWQR